jgi:carnitine O-palmitoyltransferase 1
MAEARNIAALNVSVTHDGISVTYDQELLKDIWHAFSRSYKRRIAKFKNNFTAGIFPANIHSLGLVVGVVSSCYLIYDIDATGINLTRLIDKYVLYYLFGNGNYSRTLAAMLSGSISWFSLVQIFRLSLKWFLSYRGWMYESVHDGKAISLSTKIWFKTLHLVAACKPMMHSFQGALPHLPLPSLKCTLDKHLRSMRPILNDEEFDELTILSEKFQKGLGPRLQRYLFIKSMLSSNYVSDWWEKYVYHKQRSPIMVNSNYYGFDTLNPALTDKQAARAANITWAALLFRRMIDRQEVSPFAINPRSKVPFCTNQYTRLFNSCRTPGEDCDNFRVWDDAKHIAVYHKGCWFKLNVHTGVRLLEPCELQLAFQEILDSALVPCDGEQQLAALTAGRRDHWAKVRREHFSNGINRTSLRAIERAAFVVILDDEYVCYDPEDTSKLDRWAENLLHGKGYDRWFDKSFNLIISPNARIGINAEHSWGDAAVTAHFMEFVVLKDVCLQGYTEEGNCKGTPLTILHPERLNWALDKECLEKIQISLEEAQKLIDDVEMALLVWTEYGKGFIKKLKISPDAFMQMALQLTYFKNQDKFSLTYEASMTRLYREGRTETVRSCTNESCDFVRAMLDEKQTREERLRLLRDAAERHQQLYRDAMCGKGVDRHLFALYVVMRYLEESSPLFDKIFPPQYLLSTSQTPLNQCEVECPSVDMNDKLKLVSAGGGFGPVTDTGYGVSYVIAGENQISFHISSKKSASNTSSKKFREDLKSSLRQMRELFA